MSGNLFSVRLLDYIAKVIESTYLHCLQSELLNYDIAPLLDATIYNAGFVAVKATAGCRRVYILSREMTMKSKSLDDQAALNRAIGKVKKERSSFGVRALDRNIFLSGLNYFDNSGRLFPRDEECNPLNVSRCPAVVHNNWIVSKEAKIYRFREHLMWLYDGDDQYYSSETRKYLTYTNPKPTTSSGLSHKNVTEHELAALRTALAMGHLLNRVVILPRFHCRNLECPLNSIVRIKTFDASFANCYRESSFLQHPKVPDSVKRGLINRELVMHRNRILESSTAVIKMFRNDILQRLGDTTAAVVNVGSLLGVEISFNETTDGSNFVRILRHTFRRSAYRQL